MVAAFATDGVMAFVGAPAGPAADEVRLLGEPVATEGSIAADYAWAAESRRAGRIVLTPRGEEIAALTVTFE